MIERFMRIVLFFDLPIETSSQRKAYSKFRKNLIKEGFIMLQKSVYTKLAINRQTMALEIERVKSFLPKEGLVQILTVTEKQFARITTLVGEQEDKPELSTTNRLVVL